VVTGTSKVFGLVGHPIRRSLSPAMHNKLFALKGVDAVYVAFDVLPSLAPTVAGAIRTLDLAGCNLTVPFKAAILSELDEISPTASEAQAVNVVTQSNGHLTGFNTDGEGFVTGFEERIQDTVDGLSVLIIGCGGAGRAIASTLANRSVSHIIIMNRTLSTAQRYVQHLKLIYPSLKIEAARLTPEDFLRHSSKIDLVINATAASGRASVEALSISELRPSSFWCDVNYWMENAPHVDVLESRGHVVQRGRSMLFNQGALSFEIFTGYPIDTATIRELVG
jgi:shikimate dehydrogenase